MKKRHTLYYGALFAVAVGVFFFAADTFFRDFARLQRGGFFNPSRGRLILQDPRRATSRLPLAEADADAIRAWMTFEYLNRVFGLPQEYLRAELALADARYPRVSIAEVADARQVPAETIRTQTQTAIRKYFSALRMD